MGIRELWGKVTGKETPLQETTVDKETVDQTPSTQPEKLKTPPPVMPETITPNVAGQKEKDAAAADRVRKDIEDIEDEPDDTEGTTPPEEREAA